MERHSRRETWAMADRNWFVQSFIDSPTWDAAGWFGTAFLYAKDLSMPPAMALLYADGNAARRIFEGLKARLGERDEYEELRVAIVEGDIKGMAPGYSVHIGSDIEHVLARAKAEGHPMAAPDLAFTESRIHRMNPPPTSPNLEMFKKSYARHGFYGLMAGVGDGPDSVTPPRVLKDLGIVKREIVFRRVEDIGDKDFDVVVLKRP